MKNGKSDLSDRLLSFAAEVVKFTSKIGESYSARHISHQLMRSATSAGANYEEACGAESRSDFIHKMQLVLKELRESLYWLRLVQRAEIDSTPGAKTESTLREAQELANIIAKSIVTARKGK